MTFQFGQTVEWTSQAQGSTKTKRGHVVQVVAAGQRPNREHFPDLYTSAGCGWGRKHESYVVRVGNRHYWPVVKNLTAIPAN